MGTMENFLKGLLVLLLIRQSTSDGHLSSIQSSTVPLEDPLITSHEHERSPTEVVTVVAPPSLEEVQQAVQEASEKVEGGEAEEVLKELLERVVEAALGQVEGIWDEVAVQKGAGQDAGGVENETQVTEQMVMGMDAGGEEVQEAIEGEVDGVTVADFMEETTVGVDSIGTEAVIHESLDSKVNQEVIEETVTSLEEIGKDEALDSGKAEDSNTQVVISDVGVEIETTPTVQEADEDGEQVQKTDAEHIQTVVWIDKSLQEGEVIVLPSDNSDIEATHPVFKESKVREEMYTAKDLQNHEDSEQRQVEEEVEDIDIVVGDIQSKGGDSQENSAIKQEYEVLVNGGDEQHTGVEEATSHTTNDLKEDLETTVISAPEPEDEASMEDRPENQGAAATSTALSDVSENVFTDHGNEILTPTEDLLAFDSNVAQPTVDYFVKDALAIPPQAKGEQDEYTAETKELGLEAWKTGTTVIAVLLVLETLVIIIYILKRRNKNSSQATQHSFEKGCVEPEVTTGGDSSDNTLHAGNRDTQQIAAIDLCDVSMALAQNTEGRNGEHVISMSNLTDGATEDSANIGPRPDSSQELRTSML